MRCWTSYSVYDGVWRKYKTDLLWAWMWYGTTVCGGGRSAMGVEEYRTDLLWMWYSTVMEGLLWKYSGVGLQSLVGHN